MPRFNWGGVEELEARPENSADLLLATNVLGYLSETDEQAFFESALRVLRKGGYLLLMCGNELFNLFALNGGTVDFFKERFSVAGAKQLLTESERSRRKNNRHHNPLSLRDTLLQRGLIHRNFSFSQWHQTPPVLLELQQGLTIAEARFAARNYSVDPNELGSKDQWRALFQCSIFGALFQLPH